MFLLFETSFSVSLYLSLSLSLALVYVYMCVCLFVHVCGYGCVSVHVPIRGQLLAFFSSPFHFAFQDRVSHLVSSQQCTLEIMLSHSLHPRDCSQPIDESGFYVDLSLSFHACTLYQGRNLPCLSLLNPS